MARLLFFIAFILFTMSVSAQSSFEVKIDPDTKKTLLIGKLNFNDLKSEKLFTWYQKNANYTPDNDIISKLSTALEKHPINFIVFLGTWCEDSHNLIPKLELVLKECNYNFRDLTMYALDHSKKSKSGIEQLYDIEYVPTIILFYKGTRIGKIVESVNENLEADMLKIITDFTSDKVEY